ncbi:uncharacterized protein LOC133290088 [Gastrolobium bilobum]|uniref:uncharacterized protein LOC133290088 n=1 Tax=Gastrolobium bilobum TaxID=150636 RepID=UPI002AB0D17F|nr:uncharacterized protein LOC133290088 [Gastrolobium bilobum]
MTVAKMFVVVVGDGGCSGGLLAMAMVVVVLVGMSSKSHQLGKRTVVMKISWQFPIEGYVKLNTDGTARGNPGPAACGGVIRDSSGRWLHGFACKLGVCSAFKAELRGILRGLKIAWGEGFHNIEVESDSKSVISVLTKDGAAVHWMANYILDAEEGVSFVSCEAPPSGVSRLYLTDLSSVGRDRAVVVA